MAGHGTGHFSLTVDCLNPVATMGSGSQIAGRQMPLLNQNIKARGWGLQQGMEEFGNLSSVSQAPRTGEEPSWEHG